MRLPTPARRWAIRAGTCGISAVALVLGLQTAGGAAVSHQPVSTTISHTVSASTTHKVAASLSHPAPAPASTRLLERMYSRSDPYNPAYRHPYRYGVMPTMQRLAKMRSWALSHPGPAPALSASDMSYGGGIDGIGVTDGPEKVYLVFWGSQWGTEGTDSNGNVTLSGDPNGMAPYLQQLFKGIGTGGETWSGVMTQYCQGVATGTQTCPSGNTQHVGYPTGGALAGVWVDESAAEPSAATQAQIGTEAVDAAAHFGNTTAASNRYAQYDIVSATGTDPDNYQTGGFCAWHDYNTDLGVTSPYGDIALTNMPYVTDVGTSCGENFVNSGSAGTLDGVSIVNGHEYAETVTDQNPPGGYTNSSGSEVGDLCAWNQGPGAPAANLSLTTGTFAMQSIWGNDGAGGGDCEFTHAIETNGNTVTVTNPGSQTGTVGTPASLQMSASDSQSGQTFTWTASGLPGGLSINSSSGLISGTPTTAGTSSVTVTATDTTGAQGSASFTWTISSSGGNTVTVTNPGNQTGTVGKALSLQMSASDSQTGQTFTWTASGLPGGLSINSSSGLISGTPTTAGTSSVTVTATDTTGAHGSASFSWTISSSGGCTAAQLFGNPGFETGSISPWTSTAGVLANTSEGVPAHSGSWLAWLDGYGGAHTDTLAQTVTIPSSCTSATLSFWLFINTDDPTNAAYDTFKTQVLNSSGTVVATLSTLSNLNTTGGYTQYSYNLNSYIGQKITIKYTGRETLGGGYNTNFFEDDNALNVH